MIDADIMLLVEEIAFNATQEWVNDANERQSSRELHERLVPLIRTAPTVEAIPIKWIEKQIARAANFSEYRNDLFKSSGEYEVRVSADSITAHLLTNLIKLWRLENESKDM